MFPISFSIVQQFLNLRVIFVLVIFVVSQTVPVLWIKVLGTINFYPLRSVLTLVSGCQAVSGSLFLTATSIIGSATF